VFIKVFVFVGIDHLAKQEIVDVEKDEAGPSSSSSSRTSGLPTKPKGLFPTTKKIKSFSEYKKGKGKQWKKSVSNAQFINCCQCQFINCCQHCFTRGTSTNKGDLGKLF
jgi:hypothetical protein